MEVLQWPPRKHFYHQPYLYQSRHSHSSRQPSTDVSNTVASASLARPLNIRKGGLEKIEDVTSGLLGSTTNTIQQSRIWPATAAATHTRPVSRRIKRLQGLNILYIYHSDGREGKGPKGVWGQIQGVGMVHGITESGLTLRTLYEIV